MLFTVNEDSCLHVGAAAPEMQAEQPQVCFGQCSMLCNLPRLGGVSEQWLLHLTLRLATFLPPRVIDELCTTCRGPGSLGTWPHHTVGLIRVALPVRVSFALGRGW